MKKYSYAGPRLKPFLQSMSVWAGGFLFMLYVANYTYTSALTVVAMWVIGFVIAALVSPTFKRRSFRNFIEEHYKTSFCEAYAHMFERYAFGIADDYLLIVSFGTVYEIPYDAIRDFRWQVNGYTSSSPSILSPTFLSDSVKDSFRQGQAFASSGLFIEVADIETPLVRIVCRHMPTLRRWTEAYNQKIESLTEGTESQGQQDAA